MAETLFGTVGIWGIAESELPAGLIIESIEEASRSEKNYVRNHKGARIGRAGTDESVEISLAAEVLGGTSFDVRLGAALSLANTIGLANLNSLAAGKIVVNDVKRKRGREEWEAVTVDAEMLPGVEPDPDGLLLVRGASLIVEGDPIVVV